MVQEWQIPAFILWKIMKEYKALFFPSEDTEGFVGMCLELGIVTQGNDLSHTAIMLEEAVTICLQDYFAESPYISHRKPCDKEYFDKWDSISDLKTITFNGITLKWKLYNKENKMGFFSFDCSECGHPMLCPEATNDINFWMTDVIVMTPYGIISGKYNGYGKVGEVSINLKDENTVWLHEACWVASSKMSCDYYKVSDSSRDQGWFFEPGKHDMEMPGDKFEMPYHGNMELEVEVDDDINDDIVNGMKENAGIPFIIDELVFAIDNCHYYITNALNNIKESYKKK